MYTRKGKKSGLCGRNIGIYFPKDWLEFYKGKVRVPVLIKVCQGFDGQVGDINGTLLRVSLQLIGVVKTVRQPSLH